MQKTRKYLGLRQCSSNDRSIFQTRKVYCHEKGSYRRGPYYTYHAIRRKSDWAFTFYSL
jgi:hypothetical protein